MNAIVSQPRGFEALTENRLRALAPSIFATSAHPSRSEQFRPIATIEVVRTLAGEGFVPVHAAQNRARTPDRREHTKHLIRFRHIDARPTVGGVFPEILLRNANDGTGGYDLFAALLRLLCGNGLVVSQGEADRISVRHAGRAERVLAAVVDGTHKVLEFAKVATEAPAAWSAIELSPADRYELAEAAHGYRFADADGNVDTPITVEQLLTPRRAEDDRPDLWSTFNVVQENVIRGGLAGVRTRDDGTTRRMTTRNLRAIDATVRINRDLWSFAATMAAGLTAAA